MKENWWRSKSFSIHKPGESEAEIYNTNFEGNGFKYLIRAMSRMLSRNRTDSKSIFEDESFNIVKILEQVKKAEN